MLLIFTNKGVELLRKGGVGSRWRFWRRVVVEQPAAVSGGGTISSHLLNSPAVSHLQTSEMSERRIWRRAPPLLPPAPRPSNCLAACSFFFFFCPSPKMTKLSLLLILNEYTVFRCGGLARLRYACSVGGKKRPIQRRRSNKEGWRREGGVVAGGW